jgi:hypothetical protein
VLVAGNEPTSGLSLASNVITILLITILIPLWRLNGRLAIAANKTQDRVGISIIIVILLHKHSAA